MHDALTVGVPVMVILIAMVINRHDVKDLRTEMNRRFEVVSSELGGLRSEMNRRFDIVDTGLRYFHGQTGEL